MSVGLRFFIGEKEIPLEYAVISFLGNYRYMYLSRLVGHNASARTTAMKLTEQQVDLLDSLLEREFNAHFDENAEMQDAGDLLDLITETRIDLAQSLPCAECDKPRMGYSTDLCSEHYAQLTRGELRVRV